jgi:zinc protease
VTIQTFEKRASRRKTGAGATLLALENHFNPTLALSGTLRAGTAHSPADNPMLASLTAQMLDKGTRRRGKLVLAEELESRGISISFSASGGDPDTLDIGLSCLSRDSAVAFDALVEMLRQPAFPEEELTREKERVIGGIRQLSDQTGWRASTEASRMIYPEFHPYHAETAGELIAAVEKTTARDLEEFHRRCYGSATLVLAAVGDLDREAFLEDFERRLEGFLAPVPAEPAVPAVSTPGEKLRKVVLKEKVNADVVLGHDSGLRRTDPDFLPATLGVAALGQSTLSSRLGLRVRDTEGLTYGINARLSCGRWSGPFLISLTVAPGNLSRAVASARAVVEEFLSGGIREDEMRNEKSSRAGRFKVDLASNSGIAGALDTAETYGFGVSYLDRFPELVEAVSRDAIDAAVRRHVRPSDLVEVAAGDL